MFNYQKKVMLADKCTPAANQVGFPFREKVLKLQKQLFVRI